MFRIRSFHQGQNRSLAKCPASLQAVAAAELQYVDLAGASDGHAHIMVEGVQQTCGSYYSTIRTSGFFSRLPVSSIYRKVWEEGSPSSSAEEYPGPDSVL